MEIARNCDGLPLAIKAIGGLLRTKGATELQWRGVLHDPAWKMDKTHDDLNIALYLSYEDLPPQLKQCFLYLSVFPRVITEHTTIFMWMSQGFLKVPGSSEAGQKEVEDVGTDYYRDLIRRNLIEPDESFISGSLCRMHDVVCSFGQYMAKEEALLVLGASQLNSLVSSPKLRHLSISSPELESESVILPKWSSIPENQKLLRSLIISGRMSFETSYNDSSLSRFPSLRALLVYGAESDRFLESLVKLKHLRFLLLQQSDISRLPDDIDKMRFLEHIHLSCCPRFDGRIPSSILKLERLRYLAVVADTKFYVPKGLGGLTNLRALSQFPAQMDGEWCSLQELGALRRLRILEIGCLEAVPSGLLAAKAKICDKVQLRSLFLLCYKFLFELPSIYDIIQMTEDMCQQMEEVVDQLSPPPPLEYLTIWNYIGRRPPCWMCVTANASFNSLVCMEIMGLPFCTQLPDGLCRLPSLKTLFIDHALAIRRVGPEFQRQIAASSSLVRTSPFPSLQTLRFKALPQWEEWEWEEEAEAQDIIAMPSLETLCIVECKLLRLPAGLASSRRLALRHLELYGSPMMTALENFPSVVQLEVHCCRSLKIIRGFPMMQLLGIESCSALEMLEAGPVLDIVELMDPDMETLPDYLRGLEPRILQLDACHQKLRDLLLSSRSADCSSADEYNAEMDKVKLKQGGKLVVR
jgi:hypothetical protein